MTNSQDTRDDQTDGRLLGAALRAVRRRRGLTSKQVATAMNMPLRTLAPEGLDIRADHAAAAER